MSAGDQSPRAPEGQGMKAALAAGGVLAALGASTCCLLPFALFSLGVSGAWMSNLTALSPYQPVFIAAAAVFLAAGFWRVYRRPKADGSCVESDRCARPAFNKFAKIGLWTATLLVGLALAFPYIAPRFLNTAS